MNRAKIIGAIHFSLYLFSCFFFLMPKTRFDFLFLTYVYFSVWTWTMLNGQCVISYLAKRPNDTSIDSNDIIYLFGKKNSNAMKTFIKFGSMGVTGSMIVILLRNKMNAWLGIIPILLYYWLSQLNNPTIHRIFWVVFLVFIINSLRRFIQ